MTNQVSGLGSSWMGRYPMWGTTEREQVGVSEEILGVVCNF